MRYLCISDNVECALSKGKYYEIVHNTNVLWSDIFPLCLKKDDNNNSHFMSSVVVEESFIKEDIEVTV